MKKLLKGSFFYARNCSIIIGIIFYYLSPDQPLSYTSTITPSTPIYAFITQSSGIHTNTFLYSIVYFIYYYCLTIDQTPFRKYLPVPE
jgi:hypothetical protein